jgi:hypothetical protein
MNIPTLTFLLQEKKIKKDGITPILFSIPPTESLFEEKYFSLNHVGTHIKLKVTYGALYGYCFFRAFLRTT